ncbi:MAG: hypothetical protein IKG21_04510 [Atopobiaceae bacterium]|nr:hypothetical protein [Atopobiaceae bacterium]
MAESNKRVMFRKEAMDRISNPDDLDASLQVTSPAVWVIVFGVVALVVGVLAWGVFGSVSTTIVEGAIKIDGVTRCYVSTDDVGRVDVGDWANVNGKKAHVVSVAEIPLSQEEIRDALGSEYLVDGLHDEKWSYEVRLEGDLDSIKERVPVEAVITVESVAPIQLAFGTNE